MSKSSEIRERLAALKKEYQSAAQAEFKEQLAALFAEHPRLTSFAWTQYTPHFNDGDTCEFGVHLDEPDINGYRYYDDEGDGQGENLIQLGKETIYDGRVFKDNPNVDRDAVKTVNAVIDFLRTFEKDIYQEMFGDHVKVNASRSGITTEEYSHD